MAILTNTASGGTSGTAATTANTGGASGDAFTDFSSNGTFEFSNAQVMHGALAYHAANTGTNTIFGWLGLSSKKMATRFYFRVASTPSASVQIHTFRNSVNYNLALALKTNMALEMSLGTAAGGTILKTTAALSLNTWYRVEIAEEVGVGTTDGKVWLSYFLGDSTTPVEAYTTTTADLGTTPIIQVRMGKLGNTGNTDFYFDSIGVDTATSTFLGPNLVPVTSVRPGAVVSNPGTWTTSGAASAQAALADELDTTYIQSPDAPTNAAITLSGNGILAPGSVTVSVRLSATVGSPTVTAKVELLQGASTVITTKSFTPTTTPTDYTFSLTSGELAALTDRTDLRWRITANQ